MLLCLSPNINISLLALSKYNLAIGFIPYYMPARANAHLECQPSIHFYFYLQGLKVTGGVVMDVKTGRLGAVVEKVKEGSIADIIGRVSNLPLCFKSSNSITK